MAHCMSPKEAWGKAISLVIGSVAGAITAITTFFKYIF